MQNGETESNDNGSKNFVLTWSNPTHDPEEFWAFMQGFGATFLVFQTEKAPDTGTMHYQGYVEFEKKRKYSPINHALPTGVAIWFSLRRGTQAQAITYCQKEKTRESGPWQYGKPRANRQGSRSDLVDFTEAVGAGKRLAELNEEYGPILAKYPRYYNLINSMRMPVLRGDGVSVSLRIGPTGSGKTRAVMESFTGDGHFFVSPLNGSGFWMDGYDRHKYVLLDDLGGRSSKIGLTQLLRLLDRYPVQVPIKGGYVWWYPEKIFITTNIHPAKWYKYDGRTEHYRALVRRFTSLYEYYSKGTQFYIDTDDALPSYEDMNAKEIFGTRISYPADTQWVYFFDYESNKDREEEGPMNHVHGGPIPPNWFRRQ